MDGNKIQPTCLPEALYKLPKQIRKIFQFKSKSFNENNILSSLRRLSIALCAWLSCMCLFNISESGTEYIACLEKLIISFNTIVILLSLFPITMEFILFPVMMFAVPDRDEMFTSNECTAETLYGVWLGDEVSDALIAVIYIVFNIGLAIVESSFLALDDKAGASLTDSVTVKQAKEAKQKAKMEIRESKLSIKSSTQFQLVCFYHRINLIHCMLWNRSPMQIQNAYCNQLRYKQCFLSSPFYTLVTNDKSQSIIIFIITFVIFITNCTCTSILQSFNDLCNRRNSRRRKNLIDSTIVALVNLRGIITFWCFDHELNNNFLTDINVLISKGCHAEECTPLISNTIPFAHCKYICWTFNWYKYNTYLNTNLIIIKSNHCIAVTFPAAPSKSLTKTPIITANISHKSICLSNDCGSFNGIYFKWNIFTSTNIYQKIFTTVETAICIFVLLFIFKHILHKETDVIGDTKYCDAEVMLECDIAASTYILFGACIIKTNRNN